MPGRPDPFLRYPPELRIACPDCGAMPCQPCVSARKGRSDRPHRGRFDRAAAAARREQRRHAAP